MRLSKMLGSQIALLAALILSNQAILASGSTVPVNATSQCYFSGGAFSTGQACTPDASVSLCCGPGFSCLSNGVCQATATAANHSSEYFRPTCTDQTWDSPDCPQFCNGFEDNRKGGQGLQVCDLISGTYCCKRDFDCCSNSTLTFTLGHGTQTKVIPSISEVSVTSTTVAMPNSTITLPEISEGPATSPVGLGVGLAITILILLVFAAVYYVRRRKAKRHAALLVEEGKSMGSPASTSSAFSKGPSITSSLISAPIELGQIPGSDNPQVPGAIRQHRQAAAEATSTTTPPTALDAPSIPPRNPARMTLRSRDSSLEQFRHSESGLSRSKSVVALQDHAETALSVVKEDSRQEEEVGRTISECPSGITSPTMESHSTTETSSKVPVSPPRTRLTVPQTAHHHRSMEITEIPRLGSSDEAVFQRKGSDG